MGHKVSYFQYVKYWGIVRIIWEEAFHTFKQFVWHLVLGLANLFEGEAQNTVLKAST